MHILHEALGTQATHLPSSRKSASCYALAVTQQRCLPYHSKRLNNVAIPAFCFQGCQNQVGRSRPWSGSLSGSLSLKGLPGAIISQYSTSQRLNGSLLHRRIPLAPTGMNGPNGGGKPPRPEEGNKVWKNLFGFSKVTRNLLDLSHSHRALIIL